MAGGALSRDAVADRRARHSQRHRDLRLGDSIEKCTMLYFDERGVSRLHEVRVQDNVIGWSRNDLEFSQKNFIAVAPNGRTMTSRAQYSNEAELRAGSRAYLHTARFSEWRWSRSSDEIGMFERTECSSPARSPFCSSARGCAAITTITAPVDQSPQAASRRTSNPYMK